MPTVDSKAEIKKILGVNVDLGLTMDDAVVRIEKILDSEGDNRLIATTSPYFIMSALKDPEFLHIVNNAALSLPDGVGVLYANHYLKKVAKLKKDVFFPLKAFFAGLQSGIEGFTKRSEFGSPITGVDLTYRLCELAEKRGYSVFLLGGGKRNNKGQMIDQVNYDMAEDAAKTMRSLYPNLRIIGATSQFSRRPIDDTKTLSYITDCMNINRIKRLDIMLVAYNPIQQEKWIQRNANKIPTRISVGVGRTFNYITNDMKQPSKKYEKMHLLWLYTFIKQPWRVKRVIMTFPLFPIKVFIESIKA